MIFEAFLRSLIALLVLVLLAGAACGACSVYVAQRAGGYRIRIEKLHAPETTKGGNTNG